MKHAGFIIFICLLAAVLLGGCVTRTEIDAYTITVRDTTYRSAVRNAPGPEGEHGVVFPSNRETHVTRETLSYDSTHTRSYPAFLRYGGIEFAGLITGAAGPGYGPGLFGVYSLLDSTRIRNLIFQPKSNLFQGHLFRLLPIEYRLRWFDDAPNWTIGWNAYESIIKDHDSKHNLTSTFANVYVRKRYWLRDIKPYIIAAPYFGISLIPSAYINLGGELILGSYGGFNVRGYLGIANGFTWKAFSNRPAESITTPYIGLGVSALDFLNTVDELSVEWKDQKHSAIEVSVLDAELLYATAGYPNLFDTTSVKLPVTGMSLQFATSHFPLPLWNGKFWAGTTLFKLFALGYNQFAFSVLPLRVGYREYLIAEDLTFEPFLEANYYPSQFANLGMRLRLNTFQDMTVGLVAGYATGSSGAFLPRFLYTRGSKVSSDFSSFYLGISFGVKDRMYTPEAIHAMNAQ